MNGLKFRFAFGYEFKKLSEPAAGDAEDAGSEKPVLVDAKSRGRGPGCGGTESGPLVVGEGEDWDCADEVEPERDTLRVPRSLRLLAADIT